MSSSAGGSAACLSGRGDTPDPGRERIESRRANGRSVKAASAHDGVLPLVRRRPEHVPECRQRCVRLREAVTRISAFGPSTAGVPTSKHFGYLRASFRILYNLNDMTDDSAYIVVGNQTNYWRENKLFIFDDTLLHQSFNETDQSARRFVDMIRPTPFPCRHARRRRRRPFADPEFQVCLLPGLYACMRLP